MNILALETTGKYGTAAVIKDNDPAICVSSNNEMSHLQDIINMSEEALGQAGISKNELTHVAASVGPGSFTGIRIGVTTARTLGQMLGIPCVAVSSLEGMEYRVEDMAIDNGCGLILAIINARRNQTYAGLWTVSYDPDTATTVTESAAEERQYMIDEVLAIAKDKLAAINEGRETACKLLITGDGADAYADIIENVLAEESYIIADEELRYQSADAIVELAKFKAEAGEAVAFEELMPNYMRLSEAEQRLKEGTLSSKISKLK